MLIFAKGKNNKESKTTIANVQNLYRRNNLKEAH